LTERRYRAFERQQTGVVLTAHPERLRRLRPLDIWGVGGQSLGIAVSPDQRVLAAGGADAQTGVEGFYFIPL
jgi:hypothetical protein